MKIAGIITEYNPFHNGHKYHIEETRRRTGADYVISVMSGDFVQRGEPSILPKHIRAQMALSGNADLVLELPVSYATGSAEYFASGAVALLESLGCVDTICFGSECGEIASLQNVARVLVDEPADYSKQLKLCLANGLSYPASREIALCHYFRQGVSVSDTESFSPDENALLYKEILSSPNNILGIEYCKALLQLNSKIQPYTIARKGGSYHDVSMDRSICSATALRTYLKGLPSDVAKDTQLQSQIPRAALKLMAEHLQQHALMTPDDFSLLLHVRLLDMTKEKLVQYQDVSLSLAERILNKRNEFLSYTQFVQLLKTKELTYSRISRALLHILLQIPVQEMPLQSPPAYARILAFRKDAVPILSQLKTHSSIPLLSKLADYRKLLDDRGCYLLEQDLYAAHMYQSILSQKSHTPFVHEMSKAIPIM